jgi:hypothetical protein
MVPPTVTIRVASRVASFDGRRAHWLAPGRRALARTMSSSPPKCDSLSLSVANRHPGANELWRESPPDRLLVASITGLSNKSWSGP